MTRLVPGQLQGAIDQRLVFDHPVELQAAGGGEQQRGSGVIDAQGQFVGGKAAEHHRVHGTDSRAGQHGHGGLGHHGHVDDHPIALAHAQLPQQAGQAGHFISQLVVGEGLLHAGHRRVVDQRQLVAAALLDLMVQGQVAAVQAAIGEPTVGAVGVLLQGQRRLAMPGQVFGLFGPEGSGVGDGVGVAVLVGHGDLQPGTCCY